MILLPGLSKMVRFETRNDGGGGMTEAKAFHHSAPAASVAFAAFRASVILRATIPQYEHALDVW
jgi:hypothetical protein